MSPAELASMKADNEIEQEQTRGGDSVHDIAQWPRERRLLWKRVREDGVAIQNIANDIGHSRSMLSQFLNSNNFKASKKLLIALQKYFKSINYWYDEDLFATAKKEGFISNVNDMEFLITQTCKRVWFVLDATLEGKNFGMISGPSGSGKSAAVEYWLEKRGNNHSAIYFPANGCMSRKGLLRRIAKELGMFAPAAADVLIERICGALAQEPKIIIIDEADQIAGEYKLETLRSIIDNAGGGAGIVLVGNEDLAEDILRMAVDKRKLSRIHNRFGANQRVKMPTDEEAEKLLERVNLTTGARRQLIARLQRVNGMGGYRVCRTILKTLFQAVGDGQITEDMLRQEGLANAVLSLNA